MSSKLCCLCGREGHSANACPWPKSPLLSDIQKLLPMHANVLAVAVLVIERQVNNPKVTEALKIITDLGDGLRKLAEQQE